MELVLVSLLARCCPGKIRDPNASGERYGGEGGLFQSHHAHNHDLPSQSVPVLVQEILFRRFSLRLQLLGVCVCLSVPGAGDAPWR